MVPALSRLENALKVSGTTERLICEMGRRPSLQNCWKGATSGAKALCNGELRILNAACHFMRCAEI